MVPPILAPKSPHPWASLGAPSPADAHDAHACVTHHEVTAAGGSSIIEFAGAAPRRPKTCPNATRNARAFRSHSPANFEFPRPCRRPRRGAHHEHQREPRDAAEEGRRQSRASHKGFAFTASPSSGGPRTRPQKGPAARFKSLRLKPPTQQELERTSGLPTCRACAADFRFRLCLRGEGACRKHGRWRSRRAEISVVVAFSAAHLETSWV